MTKLRINTIQDYKPEFELVVEDRHIHDILNILEESRIVKTIKHELITTKASKGYHGFNGYTKLFVKD